MSQQCSWPTHSRPLEGRCPYYALLGLTQAPGFAGGPDSRACRFFRRALGGCGMYAAPCTNISGKTEEGKSAVGCLGNALWFIFGGAAMGISWALSGVVWCLTIVGIPIGVQCFKFAGLAFFPFGKEIVYGGGAGSMLCNILWLIFSGIFLALEAVILGCLFCVTIIGIPFGKQCFKIAKLSLMPFGATVR